MKLILMRLHLFNYHLFIIRCTSVVVDFPEVGEKQFGTVIATTNGIIKPEVPGYTEKIELYRNLLKKDSSIMNSLSYAEKEFAPYSEYLG